MAAPRGRRVGSTQFVGLAQFLQYTTTTEADELQTHEVKSGHVTLESVQMNRKTSLDMVNEHDNTTAGDEVDQDCIIRENGGIRKESTGRNQQQGEVITAEVFPQQIVKDRRVLIDGGSEHINKCNQGWGFASENVVNLSNRELTIEEIKVLSRGWNFCPTPSSIDKFQLKKDIDEFRW